MKLTSKNHRKTSHSARRIINFRSILIVIGIVMVWRGIWGFMDLYLFPNQKELSYIASILLGLIILYIDDAFIDELVR